MAPLMLRARLSFALHDDSTWFTDKKRVGALVDAVLATDLTSAITHAGVYNKERAVKGEAALRKALVTGKQGVFTALDGPNEREAQSEIAFSYDVDRFELTLRLGGPTLAARTETILDSIEQIGIAVVETMGDIGGLSIGNVVPCGETFRYPRPRPPVTHRRIEVSSILDFLDLAFHRSEHGFAHPDEIEPLAKAAVPRGVRRTVHGDLVVLRWVDSIVDERAVAEAAGRHEQWLASILGLDREDGYNEHGDQLVELSDRRSRAPFTFYDADEGIGYKALIVDPRGRPDAEVWDQMVKALKSKKNGLQGIRLIVPLRKLAIAVTDQAKKAGFDAVLYPGDGNELWNPAPPGWWVESPPRRSKK